MHIPGIHAIAVMLCGLVLPTSTLSDSHDQPETGEVFSQDQTFTYRVLDVFTSIDPQLVEGVTGG